MVRSLIGINTLQEATQICWDLRLSERYPTLEFRVPDLCMTVDEAVKIFVGIQCQVTVRLSVEALF